MKAPRIFVLTGAGISADSGVATFRDADGLWAEFDWRELATPEAFASDPDRVHEFYNLRRAAVAKAEPNAAHRALAALEARLEAAGGELFLITQNVDDLHERGGSARVIHMHGELFSARCLVCSARHRWRGDLGVETRCPDCKADRSLRPDVVWFGEFPLHMDEIAAAIESADRFVSIGTSGSVYPAAGFVEEARLRGVPCAELNLEPSDNAWAFDDRRYGRASDIVPLWADEIAR
jgi:NAD-dependent deacetylase